MRGVNTASKYESTFTFLGFRVREMRFKINEQSEGQRFPLDFDVNSDFEYKDEDGEIKCIVTLKAEFFKTLAAKKRVSF